MKPSPLAVLAVFLLASFPAHAGANDDAIAAIAKCAALNDNMARLACYDEVAGRTKAVEAAPQPQATPQPQAAAPAQTAAAAPPVPKRKRNPGSALPIGSAATRPARPRIPRRSNSAARTFRHRLLLRPRRLRRPPPPLRLPPKRKKNPGSALPIGSVATGSARPRKPRRSNSAAKNLPPPPAAPGAPPPARAARPHHRHRFGCRLQLLRPFHRVPRQRPDLAAARERTTARLTSAEAGRTRSRSRAAS